MANRVGRAFLCSEVANNIAWPLYDEEYEVTPINWRKYLQDTGLAGR